MGVKAAQKWRGCVLKAGDVDPGLEDWGLGRFYREPKVAGGQLQEAVVQCAA